MRFLKYFIVLILLISYGCKSAASAVSIANLENAVSQKNFKIEFTSAVPVPFTNVTGIQRLLPYGSNQASINLINNPNHFKMMNEEVDLLLPFYGEQDINYAYSTEYSGFQFKGSYHKMTKKYKKGKGQFILNYWIHMPKENLRAILTMFPNNRCTLTVSSSIRSAITYHGRWVTS